MTFPRKLTRTLTLDVRAADEDGIPAVISTNAPVERDGYLEVLDHSPEAVDLCRAPLPLIESHNGRAVNIGIVDGLKPVDGKLRGLVKFGTSSRARELVEDVKAGIVRSLSIAYQILKHRVDGDTVTATRWRPYEASLVAIPADINAGFYRSKDTMSDNVELVRDNAGDEAKRLREISATAHMTKQHDLGQRAIQEGWTVSRFKSECLERMGGTPVVTESDLGLTISEKRDFSFVRLLRHMAQPTDRKLRNEAGFELAVVSGSDKGEGFRIPSDVLSTGFRDLTVAGTTTGSKLVGTDHLDGSFIELLRNRLVIREAGATVLDGLQGNAAIPRQTGGSTWYWVAEGSSVTESNATFDQVTMSPKTGGTFTDISRKLLIQSAPSIEQLIRSDFAATAARGIDYAALAGNPDVTATANSPRGVLYTTGTGSVSGGTNGAAPDRADLVNLWKEVSVDNADAGSLAYITNSKVAAKLANTNLDSGSGRFVYEGDGKLFGFPLLMSNAVPSDLTKGTGSNLSAIYFGNWSDILIGLWSGLDVLTDPYTGGTAGTLRIIVMQDCDIAVRHAQSFSVMSDCITS